MARDGQRDHSVPGTDVRHSGPLANRQDLDETRRIRRVILLLRVQSDERENQREQEERLSLFTFYFLDSKFQISDFRF